MSMLSTLVMLIVLVLALLVMYGASRPGSRRRRHEPSYDGPERREDDTEVDFLNQPMFTKRKCRDCDTLMKRKCNSPNCNQK